MAGFFSIFQSKKPVVASEPVNDKPLDNTQTTPKEKPAFRIGPHIVPPLDNWSLQERADDECARIGAKKDINKRKEETPKPQGCFIAAKGLRHLESEDKKKKAAEATAVKKQTSSKATPKEPKPLSYRQQLNRLIGTASESDSDEGVPLWEQSDSESEDEDALRNARRRGF